jgi:hypothetical protein
VEKLETNFDVLSAIGSRTACSNAQKPEWNIARKDSFYITYSGQNIFHDD